MKINVYGVGRSGTKAVMLYLAYQIANNEDVVHLNYEPYFHLSRKGPTSFRGLKHDMTTEFLLSEDSKINNSHAAFLRGLIKQDVSTVTKFIRGTGRIRQIDQITKPDSTYVIVRDLFGVLASVMKMNWDFYRHGYSYLPLSYHLYFKKIVENARMLGLVNSEHEEVLKDFEKLDRITANAFYWYFMNKHALIYAPSTCHFIDYGEIEELSILADAAFPNSIKIKGQINEDKFEGKNIHLNYPLENITAQSKRTKYLALANEVLHVAFSKTIGLHLIPFNRKSGELVKINNDIEKAGFYPAFPPSRVVIQKSDLLLGLEEEIFALLEQRKVVE